MASTSFHAKIHTSFLCLAITDAFGAPLEFGPRITNPSDQTTTILPNRNFGLPPGHFTDDTSMALCLARSLLDHQAGFNPVSQARLYIAWKDKGYMSSVPNRCFDIGNQTRIALSTWNTTITTYRENIDSDLAVRAIKRHFSGDIHCGNGSLMRVLPCALVSTSPDQAVTLAKQSSSVTHPHRRCLDSCALYTTLVYHSLRGATKQDLIAHLVAFLPSPTSDFAMDTTFTARFTDYTALSSFTSKPADQIKSSGYVLDTLEAALWAFFTTSSYREGAIKVVNLGDDADTVGAVYGGLAGAFYGGREEGTDVVPKEWVDAMQQSSLQIVRDVADEIARTFHS